MPDFTTTDDVRIHYEDDGQGPAVVLLHGWSGSTRVWDPVAARISGRRRVIRLDFRGCGDSQSKEGTYDLTRLAADVHELLKHLDVDNATLVGWSMGVGVIHSYLRTWGHDRVGAAALIDFPIRLAEKRDVAQKVCHQLNKRRDEFLEDFFGRMFLRDDAAHRHLLIDQAKRVGRLAACRLYEAMSAVDAPEDDTFEIPALLVFPEQGWFPEALADWRVRFPEHEAPAFAQSRHAAPLEQADLFVSCVLDFTEAMDDVKVSPA